MKIFKIFKLTGLAVILLMLLFSCSKDNDVRNDSPQTLKSEAAGDKIFAEGVFDKQFASGKFNKMLANYKEPYVYSENSGTFVFPDNSQGSGGGDIPPVPVVGNGSFTINGATYPLYFGAAGGYNDGWFDLVLIDKIPEDPELELTDFNGIYFELLSNSVSEITPGTYYFSMSEEPLTFYYAEVGLNINTEFEEYYEINGGILSFSKSGANYMINFECALFDGGTVTGYYIGPLSEFD